MRLAVAVRGGLAQQGQRQAVRVQDRVGLLLPRVAGQGLLEVAGLVEEADADQRHAQVRGRLQVVAGEDAEAAGVLRQDFGDAEFGGEVGDAGGGVAAQALVPAGLLQVPVQVLGRRLDPATTSWSVASRCSSSRLTRPRKLTGSWPLSAQIRG